MIKQLANFFNKQLKQKDKYYNKIINELVEENKQKEIQIQILCETIKILNNNNKKQKQIEKTNEIKPNEIQILEKTDKYSKPINDFDEIKPIIRSLDLRNMINRISQDSVRIDINSESKKTIIDLGFKSRYDYLYFKIKLISKNRIVLHKK